MSNQVQIDIRVRSSKPNDIESVESNLGRLTPQRQEQHRDWGTILTIIGDSLSILAGVIELWKAVHTKPDMPPVEIERSSGDILDLRLVKEEIEIKKFIAGE